MREQHSFFSLYALLPFVELSEDSPLYFGPVTFWPSACYHDFLPCESHSSFHRYIDYVTEKTATLSKGGDPCFFRRATFISIANTISDDKKEALLLNTLYLLYFSCIFRNLYYGDEIPSFQNFRKTLTLSLEDLKNKEIWASLELFQEESICLNFFYEEVIKSLGKVLSTAYNSSDEADFHKNISRRIVLSIRYLIDRFLPRFVNLRGKNFSNILFEPEDILFLHASFETLFDLNEKESAADFKHKFRLLLHFKYATPLELFWKWIDKFYEARRKIIHNGLTPDPFFRENPTFIVSHITMGVKLFIYAIYCMLLKYEFLVLKTDPYTSSDFKEHRRESTLFFWPEHTLLKQIYFYMTEFEKNPSQEEFLEDIQLLAETFISMYDRYYLRRAFEDISFIPTPEIEIEPTIQAILQFIQKEKQKDNEIFLKALPKDFYTTIEKRLKKKSA